MQLGEDTDIVETRFRNGTYRRGLLVKEITQRLLESSTTACTVNLAIGVLTFLSIPAKSSIWFWLIVGASLLRFFFYSLHTRNIFVFGDFKKIYSTMLFFIALQGAAWGYSSLYLFENTIDLHRFYLIAILCGMSVGAVLTLTPSLLGFSCYVLPCTLPIVFTLLAQPESVFRHAGFMGVVFIIAIHVLAHRINTSHWALRHSQRKLKAISGELIQHKDRLESLVQRRTHELQESRENYRQLTEEINDAIYEVNGDGTITYISPMITPILGYQPENLVGTNFTDVIYHEDLGKIKALFQEVMSGRVHPAEYRVLDVSGNPHWVRTSSKRVPREGSLPGIRGVLTDIEEEKRSELEKAAFMNKLAESQKLEALGTLAGGIAHDFNNLLMGIQGRTSLMLAELNLSEETAEHLKAIEDYVQSAANLTSQLLGTAQKGKYNPKPFDLNPFVSKTTAMFGRTKKELVLQFQPTSLPVVVCADEKQIEQVLLNMYVNSWQAMPEGGNILINLSNERLDQAQCDPYQTTPGNYARISISDTGIGMDEETRNRVFDPFFTTKAKDRGTGLGLASAYGIVKNHGGFITVKSAVNRGATFSIFLPLSDKQAREETIVDVPVVKGSETILLVDDQEIIIEVGSAILSQLGYEVVIANGGKQALLQLEKWGGRINLVILDMIMPDMDGGKVFDHIKTFYPELPVILSSGYSIDGQAATIMQKGCDDFIQKPFSIHELSEKMRRILGAPNTP